MTDAQCGLCKHYRIDFEYMEDYCVKNNIYLHNVDCPNYEKELERMSDNDTYNVLDPKYILCFSGGKDSTAMLIYLIENNHPIDEIIYVNMGDWMWESSEAHIESVKKKLNVEITQIRFDDEIKQGFQKWGFPSFINRWCTGLKRDAMHKYITSKYGKDCNIIQYIGYTADEETRINKKLYTYSGVEYPLVKAKITSEQAMELCNSYGFDFGGVYEHHSHYNCWLCPLQRKNELKSIFEHYPKYWEKLREMQFNTDGTYFPNETIFDIEKQFWEQNCQKLREQRLDARKKSKKKYKESIELI